MARAGINAILAHDEAVPAELVADHIPADSGVTLREVSSVLFPATDALRSSDADVLLVGCDAGSEDALSLIEWWTGSRPGRPVVVVCAASAAASNGFVEEVFSAGADDLLVLDDSPELAEATSRQLVFALQKAVARKVSPIEAIEASGKVICVLGPKGGIGKTITSCNLAIALALRNKRVALVDLDLQFGDVALSLGLTPDTTVYDLAVSGGELDSEKLDAFLMRHPTGLRVLAAPARPDQAQSVTAEFLADVYEVLRGTYEFVIVDTPPAFTPEVIATIDVSSSVCMVGMLDALSLKNTRLGLETLELMGYESDRVWIVLNRANTSVGINRTDVVSILGRAPDVLVPSHRDIARSVNEGAPVVISQKRSDAARAFEALAGMFSSLSVEQSAGPRRGRSLMRRGRG
ncbi:MAG: CpaE family protein [Solirubrobacteraceae bacterium]